MEKQHIQNKIFDLKKNTLVSVIAGIMIVLISIQRYGFQKILLIANFIIIFIITFLSTLIADAWLKWYELKRLEKE